MTRIARRLARAALLAVGAYPTRLTKTSELLSLIGRLRPRVTTAPLRRLGPEADGGYLVPDDLRGISACFSPGVSHRSGFEKDCADLGMRVYMADRSVEGPAEPHPLFHFTRKHLGVTPDADTMSLDGWVQSCEGNTADDLILQIDIEGHEYEVLLGLSEAVASRSRIVVAEFHWLDYLLSEPFFRIASRAFDKLLQTHTCVHIHPNNCCGLVQHAGIGIPLVAEFTFLRNDRVGETTYAHEFPHPQDRDNTRNPPLPLPSAWYT